MEEIHYNRLLDYRSLDQLSRMNDSDRASLLAEILRQSPSETSWLAIWELFATWPGGESKTRHLEVALQALAAWPDKLRFMSSSNRLLYDGDRLSVLARLVRSIEVHRREQYGSAELLAIASSEYSAELKYLSIDRSEIDSEAWEALIESPHLSNLRHLHVRKTLLGASIIQRLFRDARLPRLQCLNLIDAGIRPQHLESLRKSMPFAELCSADLSSNALGDDGGMMLPQMAWLPRIKRLSLRDNYIGARTIRALVSSPVCERMEQIDVSGNRQQIWKRKSYWPWLKART